MKSLMKAETTSMFTCWLVCRCRQAVMVRPSEGRPSSGARPSFSRATPPALPEPPAGHGEAVGGQAPVRRQPQLLLGEPLGDAGQRLDLVGGQVLVLQPHVAVLQVVHQRPLVLLVTVDAPGQRRAQVVARGRRL